MKKRCLPIILSLFLLTSCSSFFSSFLSSNSSKSSTSISSNSSSSSTSTSASFDSDASSFSSNEAKDNNSINTHFESRDLSGYVEIPKDYYSSISSWKNGEELKKKLSIILNQDNVKKMSYVGNWDINRLADEDIYNHDMVNQLYSSSNILKYNSKSNNQEGWDREHAFCASLMTGMLTGDAVEKTDIAQDFHNLFAAWSKANISRGNKNYGETEVEDGEAKVGENLYDNDEFKPGSEEDCGEGARAIFYMATRYYNDPNYPLSIQERITSSGDKAHGNLSNLLAWNKIKPSRNEVRHNAAVYSYQNNRNPFIDYPELADYIFGSKKSESGKLSDLSCTIDDSYYGGDFANYCIDGGKYFYKVGDSFSKNDFPVYTVLDNFKVEDERNDDFNLSGIEEGHIFTLDDIGEKQIEVSFKDGKKTSFSISIEDSALENMAYKHYFTTSDFETGEGVVNYSKNIDGNLYHISYEEATSVKLSQDKKGIKLGSASHSIKTFTLESESIVNNCKGFALSLGVASGCSADIDFYINNQLVGSSLKATYQSDGSYSTLSESFENSASGKIKIVISNFQKALYLYSFAIDF